jgi:glycosyltransferase involved in cell wall biosynthesis
MIVISNGFNKFHLTSAASELNKAGLLRLLITGAYPTAAVRFANRIPWVSKYPKYRRLLARKDALDDRKVRSFWLPEFIQMAAIIRQKKAATGRSARAEVSAFQLYSSCADRVLRKAGRRAEIYHYRAGFGGRSVDTAKNLGMITLCDHSSVYPSLFSYLVDNGGKIPGHPVREMSGFQRWILRDIKKADFVLVNSDFVKETFLCQRWASSRIHTIYWGVDDQFMEYKRLSGKRKKNRNGVLELLFAGTFDKRKGADSLIETLQSMRYSSWRLEIIGQVDSAIRAKYPDFFISHRVLCSGVLPRMEVARRMRAADVFVLPSLSEGSARVIFEAMACGCYIITTPNSGSIVKDTVHGALVAPCDRRRLAQAIEWAVQNQQAVIEIGHNNEKLIDSRFTQRRYGNQLITLYERLQRGVQPGK